MHRVEAALFLVLVATASCGTGAMPQPSTPDDPSTVRVIVFMRDQSGTELWVSFPSSAHDGSGSTSGVTSGVAVGCGVIPAGASVAVVAIPGQAVRLPLYTAIEGDPDKVLWVGAGTGGDLGHGEGRPDWETATPQCPDSAR